MQYLLKSKLIFDAPAAHCFYRSGRYSSLGTLDFLADRAAGSQYRGTARALRLQHIGQGTKSIILIFSSDECRNSLRNDGTTACIFTVI